MNRCKRIERVAEDHFILEIPRKAGSEYTVRMKIVSPNDRGLEKGILTIGPILAPT